MSVTDSIMTMLKEGRDAGRTEAKCDGLVFEVVDPQTRNVSDYRRREIFEKMLPIIGTGADIRLSYFQV